MHPSDGVGYSTRAGVRSGKGTQGTLGRRTLAEMDAHHLNPFPFLALLACAALAQPSASVGVSVAGWGGEEEPPPAWMIDWVRGQDAHFDEAYRQRRAEAVALERELRHLRAEHFRSGHVERRQVGLFALRSYHEPWMFPTLLDVMDGAGKDVERALCAHLERLGTPAADAALAWAAVEARSPALRDQALPALERRLSGRSPDDAVEAVLASALTSDHTPRVERAASVVQSLALTGFIPLLIEAQVAGSGGTPDRQGDLAWIMIGTQTAFVSDLQPVVADSAVAFDPQISVITEGTLLRVHDAVVVTYRTEVYRVLVEMTTPLVGRSTATLGHDLPRWQELWASEIAPALAARSAPEGDNAGEGQAPRVREGDHPPGDAVLIGD